MPSVVAMMAFHCSRVPGEFTDLPRTISGDLASYRRHTCGATRTWSSMLYLLEDVIVYEELSIKIKGA